MRFFHKFAYICLQGALLCSAPTLISEESTFNVSLESCQDFPGDWSLAPEEIYLALKYATYSEKFNILEFGAGAGTVGLSKLLIDLGVFYEYHTFESSNDFIFELPNVIYHQYYLPNVSWGTFSEWRPFIQALEMPSMAIADLVIVDGPHGVSRADWYPKFKHFTRSGTIILIDDFHHYKEFREALDDNFIYETIIEYQHSGIQSVHNEGLDRIDKILGKSFKIVRVKSYK